MHGKRWAAALTVLVTLTALSACGGGVSGSGAFSSAPASTAARSGSGAPAASVSAPSQASASAADPSARAAAPSAKQTTQIRDFTKVSYTVPPGFVRSYSYSEAIELEADSQAFYFVPKSAYNGQDVLTVLVYTLPDDVDVGTRQEQADRVDYYNKKLKASLPNGTRDSAIAGLPAFQENVVQPPNYHYSTWFAFGARHMLQFSCQVGTTRSAAPVIANACQTMHDSIRVS